MFFSQPVAVEARPNYRIWIKYADGPSGEVDLSGLVGKGAYAALEDPSVFKGVHIDTESEAITWGNNVEICSDAAYLEVTGLPFQEVFPDLTEPPVIGWQLEAEKSILNRLSVVEVKAREGYRIWLRYSDGASGEVDLSRLAGCGVFKAWLDREFFEDVYIGAGGEVSWPNEIDIDPYKLYMDVTGKTVEDLFPGWGEGHEADA